MDCCIECQGLRIMLRGRALCTDCAAAWVRSHAPDLEPVLRALGSEYASLQLYAFERALLHQFNLLDPGGPGSGPSSDSSPTTTSPVAQP